MTRHQSEVTIGCKKFEIVSNNKLRQQRINGCYLNSLPAAGRL